MRDSQKTILKAGDISGVGIHTGKKSQVFFKPAPPDTGIHFFRDGVSLGVLGRDESLFSPDDAARCSALGNGVSKILTVEHLLAAVYGVGITNLIVDVHGEEIPALDGSATPFTRLFEELGLQDQKAEKFVYRVSEPIFFGENQKAISIIPSERLEVSYCLDYDHPGLRKQTVSFNVTEEVFVKEIAPSRTFCTLEEARYLKERGFGLGGSTENNIVVSPDGSHEKDLRFPDECARHKVLDILGDLSLLGFPVLGKVTGIRSGHSLNRQLVQAIRRQKNDRL